MTTPTPPPAARGRISPWVIVVAAVASLVIIGVVVVIVARVVSGGSDVSAASEVIGGSPEAVATPASSAITPLPNQPTPSVQPIPSGPAPTPLPTPTSAQPIPSETTPVPEPSTSGESIDVGLGIKADVPQDWSASEIDGGGATIRSPGGSGAADLYVYTGAGGRTGADILAFYVKNTLSNQLSGLELTVPEPVSVNSSSIVSAARTSYRGTLVNQQGSTVYVGELWSFVRSDGVALMVDLYGIQGNDENLNDGFNLILNSSVSSM